MLEEVVDEGKDNERTDNRTTFLFNLFVFAALAKKKKKKKKR